MTDQIKNNSYQDYLDHQKEKTLDPKRRAKWLGEEWSIKLNGFNEIFRQHKNLVSVCNNALCVGARTGQEVQALRDINIDAIGIDLVPHPPLVIEGDMHNMPFSNNEFDFVFSNCFDHSLYPEKFISETKRVLKPGGFVLFQFQVGIDLDKYTETFIFDSSDFTKWFDSSEIVN